MLDEVIEQQGADPRLQEMVGKAGIARDEDGCTCSYDEGDWSHSHLCGDTKAKMSSGNPLRGILDANKLTGPNYLDWLRNLKIVLRSERIAYVLEGRPHLFSLLSLWHMVELRSGRYVETEEIPSASGARVDTSRGRTLERLEAPALPPPRICEFRNPAKVSVLFSAWSRREDVVRSGGNTGEIYHASHVPKKKFERSRKSQKTRYLSTASEDLSTDTTSQKATSSAKALPVDRRSTPVDRCNQSEDQKL
ncbi:hypothetical protein Taro_044712 [Colocasia esculenta]|uniref:Uncharacterized protein n=1 Tax=Colocasia esculenta TaxID=4460 RepID=A0A843WML2_COLES|nr:hypothetical protein [Colocasia esculenta]